MTANRVRCAELPEALADLLGGEGTDAGFAGSARARELRQIVSLHTANCSSCAAMVQGLDSILERTRSISVPEPSPQYWTDFPGELRRRIDALPPAAWYAAPGAWLRAAVAATALALLSYAFVARPLEEQHALLPSTVTNAQIHDLAQAFDRLSVGGAPSFDSGDELDDLTTVAPPSAADLFALYDLTLELDPATLDALLDELPG